MIVIDLKMIIHLKKLLIEKEKEENSYLIDTTSRELQKKLGVFLDQIESHPVSYCHQ